MKDQVRVLGIDDAPFRFRDGKVPVAAALLRSPSYLEAVMTSEVTVDGTDADDVIVEMIERSRYKDQIRLVLIDGISLGGFNVVDIDEICERTGIPVATVTRDRPDIDQMAGALRKHFGDWEARLTTVTKKPLLEISTRHKPIFVSFSGIGREELVSTLEGCTVLGALPEPVRVAHLIATAIVRGESKGDA